MEDEIYIGTVARQLSVSPEFLRTLERQNRIPVPRRDATGRRLYSQDDLMLLRRIGIGSRPRRLKSVEEVVAQQS
jgi:DNA-binding transcriptional MerR regulator